MSWEKATLGVVLAVLTSCSGPAERTAENVGETQQTVLAAESKKFTISLPSGAGLDALPAVVDLQLTLSDRASVRSATGAFLPIANSGTGSPGLTELGTDAHVGAILSVPSVTLRDRAKVDGNIQSGGAVTRQNQTVVGGTVTANSPPLHQAL